MEKTGNLTDSANINFSRTLFHGIGKFHT